MQPENAQSSISYIFTFFGDMEKLNEYLGHYSNVLLELQNQYRGTTPNELGKKITVEEKNTLISIVQSTRFWCIRSFVKLSALQKRLKVSEEEFKDITKHFNTIKTTAVPDYQVIEDFTISVNKIFVEGVASELLKSVQDYWAKMSTSGGTNA